MRAVDTNVVVRLLTRDEPRQAARAEAFVANGAWGFAAGIDLTVDAVSDVARRAVEVAQSLAPLNTEPVTALGRKVVQPFRPSA